MNENKASKTTTSLLTGVIVLLVIIIAGGVFAFAKVMEKKSEPEQSPAELKIGMESNVILNEEDAANIKKGEPFSFTSWYRRDIYITGTEAKCYIGNSDANYYDDMYIQIYVDDESGGMSEENRLYLSQIIPRGSHIETFVAEKELEPGEYTGTLVYSCLNETGGLVQDVPFVVDIHVE